MERTANDTLSEVGETAQELARRACQELGMRLPTSNLGGVTQVGHKRPKPGSGSRRPGTVQPGQEVKKILNIKIKII